MFFGLIPDKPLKFKYMDRVINDFGRTGTVLDHEKLGFYWIKWDDGNTSGTYDFNLTLLTQLKNEPTSK